MLWEKCARERAKPSVIRSFELVYLPSDTVARSSSIAVSPSRGMIWPGIHEENISQSVWDTVFVFVFLFVCVCGGGGWGVCHCWDKELTLLPFLLFFSFFFLFFLISFFFFCVCFLNNHRRYIRSVAYNVRLKEKKWKVIIYSTELWHTVRIKFRALVCKLRLLSIETH